MADWYSKTSFAGLLDDAVERWGAQEALSHEGRRFSFEQLRDETDAVARGLIALGIAPGDKVTLWMPNRPEWIFTFFALSKIGAIVVPANTRFRAADIGYVVRQSDSRTLLTVDRSGPVNYLDLTREVIPEIMERPPGALRAREFPELERVVVLGDKGYPGTSSWDEMLQQGHDIPQEDLQRRHEQVDPDGTALMMYTSGTTGFPKGVMHSHCIQRNLVDIANRVGYRSDDTTLVNWPLFHIGGLYIGPLFSVVCGSRMVLTTLFDPAESLRLIEQERVTRIWGFDTHLNALTEHPDVKTTDMSSLRTGLGAVGMESSERAARRARKFLCPTVSGWGMTEVGAGVTMGYPEAPEEDSYITSGHPLPGIEIKVIDAETGHPVPHGQPGELCVRGYSVMQGYYKKPEETTRAIDEDGWFHTGDVATMRADGAIRFLGRYKDLLKVGGENVDPSEVEGFLLGHPDVEQVQVVAAPDARLSEVVCACVVAKPGHAVTNDDLDAFCRGKLASFKIPRYTLALDEFPMTPSGKAQKFKLREMVKQALDAGTL